VVVLLALRRCGDLVTDLFDAGRGRRELDEPLVGRGSDDAGDRGLSGSGRPVEQNRGSGLPVGEQAQRGAVVDEVVLADDLVKRGRSHACSQRLSHVRHLRCLLGGRDPPGRVGLMGMVVSTTMSRWLTCRRLMRMSSAKPPLRVSVVIGESTVSTETLANEARTRG